MSVKHWFSFLVLFCVLTLTIAAQQIRTHTIGGVVKDSAGTPLAGASVKLISPQDTLAVPAGPMGTFLFKAVKGTQFQLVITLIGFEGLKRRYTLKPGEGVYTLDPVILKQSSTLLKGVMVTAVNPITIKEDTVEYKASAYKVRVGSPVEELIRKLPGLSVDKDGNITAHGTQITKIRVNGKDFFSGDVQTATKNLPADIVDKLQIIDDYGDQANITGIKTGDPEKVLNIEIKKNRNKGFLLQTMAGAGNDGRYVGDVSYFQFRDKQQISLLGTMNNINQSSFRFGNSNGQTANGITDTKSVGTNYRDEWGKKIAVYGNYSFSDQQTYNLTQSRTQTVFQQGTRIGDQQSVSNSSTANHRFSFNLEYKPDTLNYLKITPSFSDALSSSQSKSTGEISSNDTTQHTNSVGSSHADSHGPKGGITVLYNHRFHKTGRNLSITATATASASPQSYKKDNLNTSDSSGHKRLSHQFQQVNDNDKVTGETIRFSYTEPIIKKNYLELNYNLNHSATHNLHETFAINPVTFDQVFVDTLSNDFNYQFSTQRSGFNYRYIDKKVNFFVGAVAQYSTLDGQSLTGHFNTRQNAWNFFPAGRFYYEFTKGKSFTARYNESSNQPSFRELQPVTDRSSPLNPIRGNPGLIPEVVNSISLRYNSFEFKSGNVFFANFNYTKTQHEIVNSSFKRRDTLYTTYRNANGNFSLSSFLNYSKPFHDRTYTVSVANNLTYANNISYINDVANTGKNWVISPSVKFRVDLDTIMDSEVSATYTFNSTRYPIPSPLNTDAHTWVLALYGRNYFFKNWILGYDLSKTINKGFSSTLNANPAILNLYIERQFLVKNKASLRFEAFDLFNQNTGVSRSVSANSIVDTRNTRLARYYLLTFTLRLQKFAGQMPSQRRHFMRRYDESDGDRGPGNGGGGGGRRRDF